MALSGSRGKHGISLILVILFRRGRHESLIPSHTAENKHNSSLSDLFHLFFFSSTEENDPTKSLCLFVLEMKGTRFHAQKDILVNLSTLPVHLVVLVC